MPHPYHNSLPTEGPSLRQHTYAAADMHGARDTVACVFCLTGFEAWVVSMVLAAAAVVFGAPVGVAESMVAAAAALAAAPAAAPAAAALAAAAAAAAAAENMVAPAAAPAAAALAAVVAVAVQLAAAAAAAAAEALLGLHLLLDARALVLATAGHASTHPHCSTSDLEVLPACTHYFVWTHVFVWAHVFVWTHVFCVCILCGPTFVCALRVVHLCVHECMYFVWTHICVCMSACILCGPTFVCALRVVHLCVHECVMYFVWTHICVCMSAWRLMRTCLCMCA